MVGRLLLTAVAVMLGSASLGNAQQQVHAGVPLVNMRDSYYESFGTDWGFSRSGRNGSFFFNRGGANTGIPQFGGYDPNAIARFGFGTRGRNGSFYFNGWAGQGSSRSITSVTPSLTLLNGSSGYIQDLTVRPFVTGFIPVVGDGGAVVGSPIVVGGYAQAVGGGGFTPVATSPVEERLERLRQEAAYENPNSRSTDAELLLGARTSNAGPTPSVSATSRSSAERGDISLAEIRRQQAAHAQPDRGDEIDKLIETARVAEASGRKGAARIRYQQAAAKATGELKQALLAKCESLRD